MVGQAELTAIVIELLIVAVIARRSYALSQGVAYSPVRLALSPIVVLALWAFTELEAVVLIPWALPYLLGADTGIVLATTLGMVPYAAKHTTVSSDPTGARTVRLGPTLAVLFFVVFLARILVALALFPSSLGVGGAPSAALPGAQQLLLAVIDGMLSVSVGLLLARSLGIARKVREAGRTERPPT